MEGITRKLLEVFVVADGVDGRVRLAMSSKGGVAATAACCKESICREGTVATRKGSNPANMRNWQRRRIGMAIY